MLSINPSYANLKRGCVANLTCIWLEEKKKEKERERERERTSKKTDKKGVGGKEKKKAEEKERGIGRIHVSKTKK